MTLVFYDIETTVPPTDIIEFGAIVLDRHGLYETESFSTLIRSTRITDRSIACNGITSDMVKDAPAFEEVADRIYAILHGRIWAGHNICRFDNVWLKKAFARIGKLAPEPLICIDTLPLLQKTFGRRAGDMKMASLGSFFGLGQERHRAIEDCRMTIDVLKNCSMIMFLEEQAGYASDDADALPATSSQADRCLRSLVVAMQKGQDIWISYDGGATPGVPRRIKPLTWVHEPWLFEAFCYQSNMNKHFRQRRLLEVRHEEWHVPPPSISNPTEEDAPPST